MPFSKKTRKGRTGPNIRQNLCHTVSLWYLFCPRLRSGRKKEPKPKLFGPDIFGWGRGLPHEGVGAKKFGMSFVTQVNQTFWRDMPGFCRDIPRIPEKFEKNICVQFWAPKIVWMQDYHTIKTHIERLVRTLGGKKLQRDWSHQRWRSGVPYG